MSYIQCSKRLYKTPPYHISGSHALFKKIKAMQDNAKILGKNQNNIQEHQQKVYHQKIKLIKLISRFKAIKNYAHERLLGEHSCLYKEK